MCATSKDPWNKQFRPGSWPIQLWGMWKQVGSSETWAHLHVFQHYNRAAFYSKVLVGAYMYCVYMYVCFELFIDVSFCRCSIVPQEINKHNVNFRACFVNNQNFLLFIYIYIYIYIYISGTTYDKMQTVCLVCITGPLYSDSPFRCHHRSVKSYAVRQRNPICLQSCVAVVQTDFSRYMIHDHWF